MRIIRFGDFDFTNFDHDADDQFPTNPRVSLIELPDGALDLEGSRTTFSSFLVSRRFKMWTDDITDVDAIDNAVRDLLIVAARGQNVLKTKMRNNSERQVIAKIENVRRMNTVKHLRQWEELTLSWRAQYPFWLDSNDEPPYSDTGFTVDDGLLSDGNVQQEVVSSAAHAMTLANNGTARIQKGQIYIIPRAGASVTALRILNHTTNLSITFAGTLGETDELAIDLLTMQTWLNGSAGYTNISLGNQTRLMEFEVGDNDIDIESDSITGTVDVYFAFSRHYL